jgi:hypothetical protein
MVQSMREQWSLRISVGGCGSCYPISVFHSPEREAKFFVQYRLYVNVLNDLPFSIDIRIIATKFGGTVSQNSRSEPKFCLVQGVHKSRRLNFVSCRLISAQLLELSVPYVQGCV